MRILPPKNGAQTSPTKAGYQAGATPPHGQADYVIRAMPARGHMPFRGHRTQAEIIAQVRAAILGDTPAHLIRRHGAYASVPAIANDRSAA